MTSEKVPGYRELVRELSEQSRESEQLDRINYRIDRRRQQRREWSLENGGRAGMLAIAAILSIWGMGDAAFADRPDTMRKASTIERILFHPETEPEEMFASAAALATAATRRRKKRDGQEDDDGEE